MTEAEWHESARLIRIQRDRTELGVGKISVVTAGTSDIPVAEEAALTAEAMGNRVERVWDVGVAGIHRVLAERALLQRARVVIVAAGMEGALPSVVGGLVSVPVVAIPTSIGYGASFGGLAALLGMLTRAHQLTVVNIDNASLRDLSPVDQSKWQLLKNRRQSRSRRHAPDGRADHFHFPFVCLIFIGHCPPSLLMRSVISWIIAAEDQTTIHE